jgi:hypothetical protein
VRVRRPTFESLSPILRHPFQVYSSPCPHSVLDLISRSHSKDEPVAGYPVSKLCPHFIPAHCVILIQPFADLLPGFLVYVGSGLRGVGRDRRSRVVIGFGVLCESGG